MTLLTQLMDDIRLISDSVQVMLVASSFRRHPTLASPLPPYWYRILSKGMEPHSFIKLRLLSSFTNIAYLHAAIHLYVVLVTSLQLRASGGAGGRRHRFK